VRGGGVEFGDVGDGAGFEAGEAGARFGVPEFHVAVEGGAEHLRSVWVEVDVGY